MSSASRAKIGTSLASPVSKSNNGFEVVGLGTERAQHLIGLTSIWTN
jgi:hypothetical protein